MSQQVELEKQLKLASKTGKYVVGRREVTSAVKGSKLLVWSASANVPQKILSDCKAFSVPALKFSGNPVELGHACGIPFRVSVIAIKSAGDADLEMFTNSTDYGTVTSTPVSAQKTVEPETPSETPKTKAVRKRKTKATASEEKVAKKQVKKPARKSKASEKKEKA